MRTYLTCAALLMLLLARAAHAQTPTLTSEQITIDSTIGGKGFTASKISGSPQASMANCTVETANIRYTVDGTAPTSTFGMLVVSGSSFPLYGQSVLVAFRAIRTTASNATITCTYTAWPLALNQPPFGTGGNGGGGGGSSTTIIGPIGQTTMASSVSVAVASDQSAVPISSGNLTDLDNNLGTTSDAKACGDINGTLEARARCLSYIFNASFDSGNSRLNVAVQNPSPTDGNSYPIVAPGASATSTLAATACNILSTASTNSTSCKGSAGNFYGYEVYNTTTTIYYLRLYNTASAPTCSSATGFIRSVPIPPASAAGGAGGAVSNQAVPVNYGTGIGYCITASSTSTANDNAAAGIFGEIRLK